MPRKSRRLRSYYTGLHSTRGVHYPSGISHSQTRRVAGECYEDAPSRTWKPGSVRVCRRDADRGRTYRGDRKKEFTARGYVCRGTFRKAVVERRIRFFRRRYSPGRAVSALYRFPFYFYARPPPTPSSAAQRRAPFFHPFSRELIRLPRRRTRAFMDIHLSLAPPAGAVCVYPSTRCSRGSRTYTLAVSFFSLKVAGLKTRTRGPRIEPGSIRAAYFYRAGRRPFVLLSRCPRRRVVNV